METFKTKQASIDDSRIINSLIANTGGPSLYKTTFGQFNVLTLIETSILCLIATSNDNRNIPYAFIAVNDIVSLSTEVEYNAALKIIENYFEVNAMNSLFINFFVFDERSSNVHSSCVEIIKEIFHQIPYLDYLFWTVPQSYPITDLISSIFDLVEIVDDDQLSIDGKNMLMITRDKILPRLLVREARIEDNDDLLPILNKNDPNISDNNNEFFLADIIQSKDNRKRLFVGVVEDKSVGLIATDLDVNINLITTIFNVDLYPNLIKDSKFNYKDQPTIIYLIGDEIIESDDLKKVITDDRILILNRSTIYSYFTQSGENTSSRLFGKCIHDMISVESTKVNNDILAVIIVGLPMNEEDVNLIVETRFKYDIVIELKSSGKAKSDDDIVTMHKEQVETLYDNLTRQNCLTDEFTQESKVLWRKVFIDHVRNDKENLIRFIRDEYTHLLDKKNEKLLEDNSLNKKDIPEANAFAITSFVLKTNIVHVHMIFLKVYLKIIWIMIIVSILYHVMQQFQIYTLIAFDHLQVVRYSSDLTNQLNKYLSTELKTNELEKNLKNCIRDNDIELQDNPNDVCFLTVVKEKVVGCITLSRETTTNEDTEDLRANYHLDAHLDFSKHRGRFQAEITHFVVSPLLTRWTKYIIKEVMRLYGKTLLFHHVEEGFDPCQELLEELIPAKPRRMIQEQPNESSPVQEDERPLFFISKRLLLANRTTANSRLVVVGNSVTSLSFLESILFHPNIYLPNVTIVMPRIPKAFEFSVSHKSVKNNDFNGLLSPKDADNPSYRETRASGFVHKCTVVNGKLTDIDRANRSIVLSDEVVLEYDILVLCCDVEGKQFASRHFFIVNEFIDYSGRYYPATKGLHPSQLSKKGIFGIGNIESDERAISWLKSISNNDSNIVITGFRYEVLNILGKIQLLEFDINPKRIHVFIKDSFLVDFPHAAMNAMLSSEIDKFGYNIHSNSSILDVKLDEKNILQGVVYSDEYAAAVSKGNRPSNILTCSALLTCSEKFVDKDTFSAINEAGLVYDGGLVVDENMKTNDPYIYAAGDFTRFSRIYGKVERHYRYNSKDLGRLLASSVLSQRIDPISALKYKESRENMKSMSNELPPLPKMLSPKSMLYNFPGKLKLFHSTAVLKSLETNSMVTVSPNNEYICSIEVDYLGSITELMCLTKSSLEERNLCCIVGLHENYLNSAVYSFDQGMVSDWISFLRENWARMLYHDRFADLIKSIETQLHNDKGYIFIIDKILETADGTLDDNQITITRRKLLGERCETLSDTSIITIENSVLEFIRENRITLPNYYISQSSNK